MFPQMTDTQNKIMMQLQTKKADELDPFEMQMRGQAGKLSMQLDQLGTLVNNLRDKLTSAEKEQNILVGEFQGLVMAVEAYHLTKMQQALGKEPGKETDNVVPLKPDQEKENKEKPPEEKPSGKGNKSKK